MIVWLTLGAVVILVGAVSWWMLRRDAPERTPADTDWGDWPSDQMGL